jgi:hypothetical protein
MKEVDECQTIVPNYKKNYVCSKRWKGSGSLTIVLIIGIYINGGIYSTKIFFYRGYIYYSSCQRLFIR